MTGKSITSYDVAKAAKVSQSAVSRAFSPGAPIAQKTRARILKVARELGYQPNAIARSMSTARNDTRQKSGMVGVIVTRPEDPFFAHTIARFSRSLQAKGWQMLLFTVDDQTGVDDALNSLMQFKIDGVIILSAILSEHMAGICRSHGIPVLLYNRSGGGLAVNSVQIENREGGRIAANLLCESDHKRIAFVGGEAGDATSGERREGFVERLAEDGRELFLEEAGDFTFDSGREAGARLFSRTERPDAIFCASDVMALGVLHAARLQFDLHAPKDFSLIGFDDIPAAAWPGHELTTIRQPIRRMIQEAVGILVAHMAASDVSPQTPRFSGTLIVRDTVRKAF